MELYVRQTIRLSDGPVVRIVWRDPTRMFVMPLEVEGAWPWLINLNSEALADIKAADDPFARLQAEHTLTPEKLEARDRNWELISPLLSEARLPDLFSPDARGPWVVERAKETGSSNRRIYLWLRRYWVLGMTRNAVAPNFEKRGGPGVERPPSGIPRGRPPAPGGLGPSLPITAEHRAVFVDAAKEFYEPNPQVTYEALRKEIVDQHFVVETVDELGRPKVTNIYPQPSTRQLRYWLPKDRPDHQSQRIRLGFAAYEKDHRAVEGTSRDFGPDFRFQIDAWIAQFNLRSRYSLQSIGRPVVYLIVDPFDDYIHAAHVGIEAPCWAGAMQAIANLVRDKVEYAAAYGVRIRRDEWSTRHLPEKLLGDGGEVAGYGPEVLASRYQTEIETAEPKRGDRKGNVEKSFDLIPAKFEAWVGGWIDPGRHGPVPPHKRDGEYDVDGFVQALIEAIIYHNNHHVIETKKRPVEMIAAGVPAIPRQMREWGIKYRSGQARVYDYTDVRISLLPTTTGKVTEDGFEVFGTFYTCELARKRGLFRRARDDGVWPETFSFDPMLTDEVFWHVQGSQGEFVACGLTDAHSDRAGLTHQELMLIAKIERDAAAQQLAQQRDAQQTLVARLKRINQRQREDAARLPQALSAKSGRASAADRKAAQAAEAERHRSSTGASETRPKGSGPITPEAPSALSMPPTSLLFPD